MKLNEKQIVIFLRSFFSSYNIAVRRRKSKFKFLCDSFLYLNLLKVFVINSIIKNYKQNDKKSFLISLPYDSFGNVICRKIYFYQNRKYLFKVNFSFIQFLYKSSKVFFNIKYLFLYKNKFYILEDLYKLLLTFDVKKRKKFSCFIICKIEY